MKLPEIINEQYGLSKLPEKTVYAMAYVPFQAQNETLFSPDHGFAMGTMYPKLNKQFYGSRCGDDND